MTNKNEIENKNFYIDKLNNLQYLIILNIIYFTN